jgi:hypothetical protein
MRLKARLIEFASVSLIVAFAASDAFAQAPQSGAPGSSSPGAAASGGASGSAGQESKGAGGALGAGASAGATGKAGASTASQGPWSANNVTAARPFGDISIEAAGTTNESVRTWAQSKSASERAEISGRCEVITDASNSSRYPMNAQAFCRTYMMVAALNAPSGGNPAGVPGAASTGQSGGQLDSKAAK